MVITLGFMCIFQLEILGVAGNLLETEVPIGGGKTAEGLGEWEEVTACSRTCGAGVRLMERKCSKAE